MNFGPLLSSLRLDDSTLRILYNTVFFPRKLIQRLEDLGSNEMDEEELNCKYNHKEEHLYILLILETFLEVKTRFQGIQIDLESLFESFRNWFSIQNSHNINEKALELHLQNLKPGIPLLLYLRGQNASIAISTEEDESKSAEITIFQPSSKSKAFMESCNDFSSFYPTAGFELTKNSIIKTKAFSKFLADLSNFSNDVSKSTSTKKYTEIEELRDTISPKLVYEWFLPFCCSKSSENLVQVIKKYRDHAVSDIKGAPFRRSGMWFTVKTLLNVLLVKRFGEVKGKVIFKIMMISAHFILAQLVPTEPEVDFEVIQKLAKRINKLECFRKDYPDLVAVFDDDLHEFIRIRREMMDLWFKDIVLQSRSCKSLLDPYKISTKDIFHDFRYLVERIQNELVTNSDFLNVSIINRKFIRVKIDSAIPETEIFDGIVNESVILQDFEAWVRTSLNPNENTYSSAENFKIFSLLSAYLNAAIKYYNDDPVGYSRMVLTASKILYVIDFVASKQFSILLDYKLGISPNVFSDLLLPTLSDLQYAQEIFNYFSTREAGHYPDLLTHSNNYTRVFAERFYSKYTKFSNLENEIDQQDEKNIQDKEKEFESSISGYLSLLSSLETISCKCENYSMSNDFNSNSCEKCSKIDYIRNMSISIYEKLLPEKKRERSLVIFELLMPQNIATLRDALQIYRKIILKETQNPAEFKGAWNSEERLASYSNTVKKTVTLRSTSNTFAKTHFSKIRICNNSSISDYIKPNGYNCYYGDEENFVGSKKFSEKLKENFSFKTEGKYKELQWVLLSNSYNENEAIASQGTCHQALSKKEFLKFTMFRAGSNLVLYNLLDAVETKSLSFGKKSVFYLVCQTLWEVGPLLQKDPKKSQFTRGQELLKNDSFLYQLHKSLSNLLDDCVLNWNQHLVLGNVVFIILRVVNFSSSPEQLNIYLELLLRTRKIGFEWIKKIEERLLNTDDLNQESKIKAKGKLLEICCFCVLTFYVEKKYLEYVLKENEDIICLLLSMTKIYDLKILHDASKSPFRKNVLSWTRMVIKELEDYLIDKIRNNFSSLAELLHIKWPESLKCKKSSTFDYDPSTFSILYEVVTDKNISKSIEIGLDGAFLINNEPLSKLPSEIYNHRLFTRLFSKTDFDVSPSLFDQNSKTTNWININESLRFSYTFTYTASNSSVLQIKETCDDNGNISELELIPDTFFLNILPINLIEDYSHWLDRLERKIYFRVKNLKTSFFSNQKFFTLDLNQHIIQENSTKHKLISINSNTFNEFYSKVGFRLESYGNILMFLQPSPVQKIRIDFPRLSLNFELSLNRSEILSKQFSGFKVSEVQTLETLIGLEKGLILIETGKTLKKKIIIPNGKLIISQGKSHQNVDIDLQNLRSPSFFIYNIDYRLGVLKAGDSRLSWIYLANLHAVTSSILPDPFLKITGTARALEILQSPLTFSCLPLDKDSRTVLKEISSLSPLRKYVPPDQKLVERVVWPEWIPSYVSHDAFKFLTFRIKEDSFRLDNNVEVVDSMIKTLYVKAYKRLLPLNLKVSKDFDYILTSSASSNSFLGNDLKVNWNRESIINARKVAFLNGRQSNFKSLASRFYKLKTLRGKIGKIPVYSVSSWMIIAKKLTDRFIEVYELCRTCPEEDKFGVLLGLSLCAYVGADIELVRVLAAVLNYQSMFNHLLAPEYEAYEDTEKDSFNRKDIKDIITSQAITLQSYSSINYGPSSNVSAKEIEKRYSNDISLNAQSILKDLENQWPCAKVESFSNPFFDCQAIFEQVSEELCKWFKNFELSNFFKRLKEIYASLPQASEVNLKSVSMEIPTPFIVNSFQASLSSSSQDINLLSDLACAKQIFKTGLFIQENLIEVDHENDPSNNREIPEFPLNSTSSSKLLNNLLQELKSSWNDHQNQKFSSKPLKQVKTLESLLTSLKNSYQSKIKEYLNTLESVLFTSNKSNQLLQNSLIFPQLTSTEIQKQVLSLSSPFFQLEKDLLSYCGAICVLWTLEQRVERCLSYLRLGSSEALALSRELESVPYQNWSPEDYPEWLILQIELDLMIRPVQVDVAKAMMNPENHQSQVIHLKMGEGKTSVILPMMALILGNQGFLVRINVLKSLFHINRNYFTNLLGGVLSRRVYVLPCTRQSEFNLNKVTTVHNLLKECLDKKGVLVTLPEFRLSFKLKGLELARSSNQKELAERFIMVHKWLEGHCRDLIDEADEIFTPKCQLVYTIGEHSQTCFRNLRLKVSQAVLDLAKHHFSTLEKTYGKESVFLQKSCNIIAYPHFRFINRDAYKDFCKLICYDILQGKCRHINFFELKDFDIDLVSEYLLNHEVSSLSREKIEIIFRKDSQNYEILTFLRGLFAFDILFKAFSKRWRVNYGVNGKSEILKQAVPFRAKDVPAESALFAHPDIAILLTQLSYFYSGLTDRQLDEVFDKLTNDSFSETEYESWIQSIPKSIPLQTSLKSLKEVNSYDLNQKQKILYPILRMHTSVINYWLNNYIYPKEVKEFNSKLSTSCWDLSLDKSLSSGFSGTSDSKILLPLNAHYLHMSNLSGTNGSLLEKLIHPDNNFYYTVQPGTSTLELLRIISKTDPKLKVILDVGALMLEPSNMQLVQTWLELRPDLEAGIYFDENDEIKVIDQKGNVSSFECSPYKSHLQACVIYLDDFHTRGTDLKIPEGTIAAVTLAQGLTKDRLIQACMRMRLLGEGHRVSFFASHEVDFFIRKNQPNVGVKEIVEWSIENTRNFIEDQVLNWALQGISFYRQLQLFENYLNESDLIKYSALFEEKEEIDVFSLYESDRIQTLALDGLNEKIKKTSENLKSSSTSSSLFDKFAAKIIETITENIDSNLLNLERKIELEEEVQIEVRKSAVPLTPQLSKGLNLFIKTGVVPENSQELIHIGQGFILSSLKNISQASSWSKRIFLSSDFINTVSKDFHGDSFLKHPRWICYNSSKPNGHLVIISAFEAEYHLRNFSNQATSLALLMPRSRVGQQLLFSRFNVEIPRELLQQVAVFAGSMFLNEFEVDEFFKFIGYCPGSMSLNRVEGLELIEPSGFVKPEHRMKILGHDKCLFTSNPQNLIVQIAEVRNFGVFSRFSHYFEIFYNGRKMIQNE